MQPDRERLEERALVQGDALGQTEAEVGGVGHVARRSHQRWRGKEAHVGAEIVADGLARPARAAGHSRLDGHTVAHRQVGRARADGN